MNLSELIAAYGEQALDKAAREGYAVRCKTHGPRVLAQYASADIMQMQLDDARVVVSAYLDALSVPAAAVVGEPVAWTGSGSMMAIADGREGFIWPTKADAHPIPLYAAPSAPDGWQPIETAPKDETTIWVLDELYGKPWHYECNWNGIEWYHGFGVAWPDARPTHWRPLPAPPALGGASHE